MPGGTGVAPRGARSAISRLRSLDRRPRWCARSWSWCWVQTGTGGPAFGTINSIALSLTVADPDVLGEIIAGHLDGTAPLARGLALYYALERTTSLLEFHTMLREGERNRTRDGLQQSYGDHNRLLMHALDRLLAADADWLREHVSAGTTVDLESLETCAAVAGALSLSPEVQIALWLSAALHDCGKLSGQSPQVDVEDGLIVAGPVLQAYCPPTTRPIAEFTLRHHDYVKDAFLGEAPVGALADDLAAIDAELQPVALLALGLIQVAGASSLGEGRLTDFRLDIFHACTAGTALTDRTPELRLARLLAPAPDWACARRVVPDVDAARVALDPDTRTRVENFLEHVFVHGWQRFACRAVPAVRLRSLEALATLNKEWRADHLVFSDEVCRPGDGRLAATPAVTGYVALSGSRTVTILP